MATKVGHTALAVLKGKQAFAKGGLATATEQAPSYLDMVNDIIRENKGEPVTYKQYTAALATGEALGYEGVPLYNPELAALVQEQTGLPAQRTRALLTKISNEKVEQQTLTSLMGPPARTPSPFDPPTSEETYYATLAQRLRIDRETIDTTGAGIT